MQQAGIIPPGEEEPPPFPPDREDEATEQVQEDDHEGQAGQQQVPENASTSRNESQTIDEESETVFRQGINICFGLKQLIGTAFNGDIKVYRAGFDHTQSDGAMPEQEWFLAVKVIIKADQKPAALNDLRQRVEKNALVPYHQNILGIYNQFTDEAGNYCVSFPTMDMGSLRSIMHSKFPKGFSKDCIIVVLREALEGLNVIHKNGQVHKEISAGHIFLGKVPEIKLAFSATVYDHGVDQNNPSSSAHQAPANICRWAAAPEVFDPSNYEDYTPKADIWLIGVTALELALGTEGRIPGRGSLMQIRDEMIKNVRQKPLRVVGEGSQRRLGNLIQNWKKRMTATRIQKLVFKCLDTDPKKRPTAEELLGSKIFRRKRKNVTYFYNLVKADK